MLINFFPYFILIFYKLVIFNHKRHCYFVFIKFINIASHFWKIQTNGLITSLSLYPIKYINELSLPYCSFLETNILLKSISSAVNIFFIFVKFSFFLFKLNLCFFSVHFYILKKHFFFYIIIIVYVHLLYIFYVCLLIWLIRVFICTVLN